MGGKSIGRSACERERISPFPSLENGGIVAGAVPSFLAAVGSRAMLLGSL